jgi:heterodisulfide reductase subunit A
MTAARSVLVVGGGIGGMRAAVDLADAGIHVYLVERAPSLGGRVAQLGYMFPTHDCVLCRGTSDHGYGCSRPSISPVLLDHNTHPNITLLTLTEVVGSEGEVGDFHVHLRQHPRYVDPGRCINCARCAQVCPEQRVSEFQAGLANVAAIHKSAPRSIPDSYYLIEKSQACDTCQKCVEVCPTRAVDLRAASVDLDIHVGVVILALGFQPFDARSMPELGLGRYKNVITSMQYERLASRSGPTEGVVLRLGWQLAEEDRLAAMRRFARPAQRVLLLHLLHVCHQGSDAGDAARAWRRVPHLHHGRARLQQGVQRLLQAGARSGRHYNRTRYRK